MKKSLWVIESNPTYQKLYREVLGVPYHMTLFSDLRSFKESLLERREQTPFLILASLLLPDEYFTDFLCSRESEAMADSHIVVASVVDNLDVLRLCYDNGVCAYFIKPFKKEELIAKIEQMSRLEKVNSRPRLVSYDSFSMTVCGENQQYASLTHRESQIFKILNESPNRWVSKEDIFSKVWDNVRVGKKVLNVHFSQLRKRLRPLGVDIRYSRTHGYQLAKMELTLQPEKESV